MKRIILLFIGLSLFSQFNSLNAVKKANGTWCNNDNSECSSGYCACQSDASGVGPCYCRPKY